MPRWVWWGGAALLAYAGLKKITEEKTPTRVSWTNASGAQTRNFEKKSVAQDFANALITAGARDVQVLPLV